MKKLKSLKFLETISKKLKKNKRKIVLCHGDFDFLHLGHLKHFKAAKEKADYLVVSVTSDSKMQKGIGRPSTNAAIIETLRFKEYVEIENRTLTPTGKGASACAFLDKNFNDFIKYATEEDNILESLGLSKPDTFQV